ncbi:MAG: hypothetical protein B6243_06335 [Anaerolineaceae bacterium 4572_5.2]|nr:MAG: hypothetical protein B6243_06335 [Anaerolineaceae bacterium 4572_5.2]
MKQNIENLRRALLISFVLVGLGLLYWQLIRANTLLARDDNPRLIIARQRIKRAKILTTDSVALAETVTDLQGFTQRRYPYPNLAAVTGYYSVRYGSGGLEAAFDERLSGEDRQSKLDALLHRPARGENITTTIHLPAQIAADAALAEADAVGAVIVLNAETGELLTMASRPTFDPNTLDEDWNNLVEDPDAPLLNRAAQGIFPLGEMARLVGLIGLYEAGTTVPADPLTAPLPEMLAPLSAQGLAASARQLRFDRKLPVSLPTEAGFIPDGLPDKAGEIAATPLHLALVGAALSQGGLAPAPVLAYPASDSPPAAVRYFGADTAALANNLLTEFSALASPEVTGSHPLSWYLSWGSSDSSLVVVAVVVTPEGDRLAAKRIAEAALRGAGERVSG